MRRFREIFTALALIVIIALVLIPLDGVRVAHADESIPEPEASSTDSAVIVTGDAESGMDTESILNFNETSSNEPDSIEETHTDSTTDVPENTDPESVHTGESSTSGDVPDTISEEHASQETQDTDVDIPGDSISVTQEGNVSNTATVTAETGQNSALGEESTIVTGNAIAYANIVNVVNTNIFNSDGAIGFFNEVLGVDAFDLRDAFTVFDDTTAVSTPSCMASVCGEEFTVTTNNTATITNDVVVRADSGGNEAGNEGTIYTGDAYAAANIFNLANTNITDSNYLLISFNNFGDYAGDIVLPGADMINSLFSANGVPLHTAISSTNDATIENTLTTHADTGDNSSAGGIVGTGNAYTNSSVQNVVNTNLFGGSDFILALRIHGDWDGEVFGLPEGIAWTETPQGIMLYSTGSNNGAGIPSNTTVDSTNTASIQNNISVYALTGENRVGNAGVVQTGDAYAAANVTNVANTTILGQNWALLIFDIFGNWSGDLAFGRPDLWIGGAASSPSRTIMPGSEVTYTYTVTNNGDSVATDVILDHHAKSNEIVYTSGSLASENTGDAGHSAWSLGSLAPHETKEIQIKAKVHSELGRSKREIVSSATVHAHETDADTSDNTEFLSIYSGKNGGSNSASKPAQISLTKTSNVDAVTPGGSADYTITITNNGGPLYKSIVRDVLKNPNGATSSVQYWDLGTIHAGETVSVTYTMEFADDTSFGTYTNTADVVGLTGHSSLHRGKSYDSPDATDTIYIGDIEPQVLGLSTTRCAPYLTTYMKYGKDNDPSDVRRLQAFLNTHMNSNLAVTGVFDYVTEIAVRTFQSRYADDVLNPWGLTRDSGHVYYTTQKKINEIQCNNEMLFPLSIVQFHEIDLFKTFAMNAQTTAKYLPSPNVAYASSDDTSVERSASTESTMNIEYTAPEMHVSQSTTSEIQHSSFFDILILPLRRAFEWSRQKYSGDWF